MVYLSRASSDLLLTINSALDHIIYYDEEQHRWTISFGDDEDDEIEAIARLMVICQQDEVSLAQVLCVLLAHLGTFFLEVAEADEEDPKELLTEMSLDVLSREREDVGGD